MCDGTGSMGVFCESLHCNKADDRRRGLADTLPCGRGPGPQLSALRNVQHECCRARLGNAPARSHIGPKHENARDAMRR